MKIFVISLASASERRLTVREQFRSAGLPFSFFDAYDGQQTRVQDHFEGIGRVTYRLNTYRDPLPSEIACYASHLALWKHAAATNRPIVILEDDCDLSEDFPCAVRVAAKLASNLGFVRLQSFERSARPRLSRPPRLIGRVEGYDVHYLSDVPLYLVGYAIGPSAAARLVSASRILSSPVDKLVQRTWEHGVPVFAMTPAPVGTSICARNSTIGDRSHNKRRTVWWMLRRAGYKAKGEVRRMAFNREQLRHWTASEPVSAPRIANQDLPSL